MVKTMRRGVTIYTLKNGEEYTIGGLSKLSGISVGGLYHRFKLGYSVDEAIVKPLEEIKRGKKGKVEIEEVIVVKNKQEKKNLIKIMSVPINPKKDAYLMLSIQAKSKNWNLRKEQR